MRRIRTDERQKSDTDPTQHASVGRRDQIPDTESDDSGIHGMREGTRDQPSDDEHLSQRRQAGIVLDGAGVHGVAEVLNHLEAQPDHRSDDEAIQGSAGTAGACHEDQQHAEPFGKFLGSGPGDGRSPVLSCDHTALHCDQVEDRVIGHQSHSARDESAPQEGGHQ